MSQQKGGDTMNFFAVAIICLFISAGVFEAVSGRWNEAIYSISGAILNIMVYFKPFSG